ncbi:hypothetical protein A2276_06075 [candidate division WOR-1 bacterium RIFOXYA12_FULL_43_27]|uniref:Carrier domain-containing protein n=1 Tax=candidate division WOR-1 bacterium RIFOXYC2_FULL_46_14 TaxID=1802587 RepID=A0A1F4U385_UNCSA|nr:MAG: hypothetical protein A2276_06075 [candidate division WOR-1 bacterium RIFOXYA12_FULL_43_27]OGC20225.1 MAG: hypothetical protein A2292_04075 [candidate division WOR-1 bacterium RIFOXYB2_FULL_46_45]OGC32036.1 MAG: hypothetical protein A2232_07370 [candidate division WOR-1 bacterium RIFOXYA2_FULL_46_56]OGC39438.1 MAG: hypothetical protein A2438_07735 [candidate division WOR-1 bacterium RIFOXYC2_FULL_46_14]
MGKIGEQEILAVIQDALKPKTGKITLDSAAGVIEEWDSIGHLGILVALDKFFNGKVASISEMANADSVKKILQILRDSSLIIEG